MKTLETPQAANMSSVINTNSTVENLCLIKDQSYFATKYPINNTGEYMKQFFIILVTTFDSGVKWQPTALTTIIEISDVTGNLSSSLEMIGNVNIEKI